MIVIGAKVKNGRRYPVYGCAAHRSKGAAICENSLTISEGKLVRAIFSAMREALASRDLRQRFADRFARRMAAKTPANAEAQATLRASVTKQEARVRRVTEAFATVGRPKPSWPSSARRRQPCTPSGRSSRPPSRARSHATPPAWR
jgi:hypothetical protein